MDFHEKVVWAEGMFLRPQHFQQLERYGEAYSHRRSLPAEPYFWGFHELVIDESALSLGMLSISSAAGLFPDGTPFRFGASAGQPLPLHFSEGPVEQTVYLCLPLRRAGAENVIFETDPKSTARYLARDAMVADENSVAGEPAELQLGAARLQLVAEADLNDAWLRVGACRVIECRNDKRLVLDPQFTPPVTACSASGYVTALLNEAFGLVNQRADVLAGRLSQPGRGGVSEVAEFLLLQMLNRYQQLFSHFIKAPSLHPERLFQLLLQVTGELASFVEAGRRPGPAPEYRHDDLHSCMQPLLLKLQGGLSMVLEQNAVQIELKERQHGIRTGQVSDRQLLQSAQFVLAVHADVGPEVVRARFPTQVKIGPPERIRDLVNLQLPGIGLRLLPIAPRQIPYHAGYHYFELETRGDLWQQLREAGVLAMHLAGEFPGLDLECWAIRQ